MAVVDRTAVAEAAAAEREARSAWQMAEVLDTRETWLAAAEAAREALETARRVEWPLVIEASLQAERLATANAGRLSS